MDFSCVVHNLGQCKLACVTLYDETALGWPRCVDTLPNSGSASLSIQADSRSSALKVRPVLVHHAPTLMSNWWSSWSAALKGYCPPLQQCRDQTRRHKTSKKGG